METSHLTISAIAAFALSLLLCMALVGLSRTRWRSLVRQGDLGAVQAAHSSPTPRVGGAAIIFGYLLGCAIAYFSGGTLWLLLMVAVVPLFVSGGAEDLGFRVSPAGRLAAAVLSSALAVILTGAWIGHTGLYVLDPLFAWSPFAVVITVVAAATISHAFNLIDGLNGLSGSTAILASGGIAATAFLVGDTEIAMMGVLLAAATMGFLVLNFPSGKIFLGDAGAYTLGFLLAWMGIALISRNPDVAPISVVMVMFWPLADLSLAIYRRYRCNLPVSHPDRLHFHQIVMRGLEICVLGRGRRSVANPMATLVLLPLIATPVVVGVLMHDLPRLSFLALVACLAAFFGIYGLGMRLATSRARSSLMSSLTSPRGRVLGRA